MEYTFGIGSGMAFSLELCGDSNEEPQDTAVYDVLYAADGIVGYSAAAGFEEV